jgi:hypothetical protein
MANSIPRCIQIVTFLKTYKAVENKVNSRKDLLSMKTPALSETIVLDNFRQKLGDIA